MDRFVVLLKGVNVAGKNMISMDTLKNSLSEQGFLVEHTYLQSGNLILQHEYIHTTELEEQLTYFMNVHFQMDVPCLVRTPEQWKFIVENNPYIGKRNYDSDKIFATFLKQECNPDKVMTLDFKQEPAEEFEYIEKTVYLYCPNGYGRTKLTNANFERKLKTQATTRNWKTIESLFQLLYS